MTPSSALFNVRVLQNLLAKNEQEGSHSLCVCVNENLKLL